LENAPLKKSLGPQLSSTADSSLTFGSTPLAKPSTLQLSPQYLELPTTLRDSLHAKDNFALKWLCQLHESLQSSVIRTLEEQGRMASSGSSSNPDPDLFEAVALIHQLRYHVTECFKYALLEVQTNPDFHGEQLYNPALLRHLDGPTLNNGSLGTRM
jgi:hypothetical protein